MRESLHLSTLAPLAVAGAILATTVSCGFASSGGDPEDGQACIPGSTRSCACVSGASGAQSCVQDGTGFGPCECQEPPTSTITTNEETTPTSVNQMADERRQQWLSSTFRCRAISTSRYRECRFHTAAAGRVQFRDGSVRCSEVVFGPDGNPSELNGCNAGADIRMPRNNRLERTTFEGQQAWVGSRRGWTWTNDGTEYCCPGIWLVEPE